MARYIYINGVRYNYYETYDTWRDAHNVGKHYKKRNGSRWFILKIERGFMFPEIKYKLYLTKTMRLFG